MRTPTEALKEVRDRLTYFCARLDGKYDPPWAQELVGIIDDALAQDAPMSQGNAAKLREALRSCFDTICRIVWIDDPEYDEDGHYLGANYAAVSRDKARAALAEPPRNCDVGTPEEQTARYKKFCYKNKTSERSCGDCPAYSAYAITKKDCRLAWAQMPYEEGGAK